MATGVSAVVRRGVVFLHIPKTAGMSFREVLLARYGAQFHYCDDPTLEGLEAALMDHQCVELHSLTTADDWYIVHAELVRQNRLDLLEGKDVFTMFRDPVDLYLSSFYYLQAIRQREVAEPLMKRHGISFPESLEGLIQHPASFNGQLAFLVGKSQHKGDCVDRADLDVAKELLVRLKIHVGLTERFEESVHMFEQVTGKTAPGGVLQVINRNRSRPRLSDVPEWIKDRIREGSALDAELYSFGRDLFLAELERCGPAPEYRIVDEGKQAEAILRTTSTNSHPEPPAATAVAPRGRLSAWSRSWSRLWNHPR